MLCITWDCDDCDLMFMLQLLTSIMQPPGLLCRNTRRLVTPWNLRNSSMTREREGTQETQQAKRELNLKSATLKTQAWAFSPRHTATRQKYVNKVATWESFELACIVISCGSYTRLLNSSPTTTNLQTSLQKAPGAGPARCCVRVSNLEPCR